MNSTQNLLNDIVIDISNFNELKDLQPELDQDFESTQTKMVTDLVAEVFQRGGTPSGPFVMRESIKNIQFHLKTDDKDLRYVVGLFNKVIKLEVSERLDQYQNGDPDTKAILEEAGYLEKPKIKLEGLEKLAEIFWDPKGSPVPRQMTEDWGKIAYSLVQGILGAVYSKDENPTIRATANAALMCNIAYIVTKLLAPFVFTYFAGTIYRNRNK